MKESHYNMYMKNVETFDTTMGHHCASASITTKRNLKIDLGKCVQMYRAPFLNLPLPLTIFGRMSLHSLTHSLTLLGPPCEFEEELLHASIKNYLNVS